MDDLKNQILNDLNIPNEETKDDDLLSKAMETRNNAVKVSALVVCCPPPISNERYSMTSISLKHQNQLKNQKKKQIVTGSVPLNYGNYLSSAYKVFEEETLIKIEGQQMKSHMGSMLDQCKAKQASQGDKLMLRLRHLLDYVPKSYKGWERSKMQKMFHRKFMQATCIHLYRNDADIDMDRIMKMNKFDNLKQQVLCLTPRRFGKSTSVAMFVASYVLTVPNSEQCIFSTGRRASQKLLELIRDMIKAGKDAGVLSNAMAKRCSFKGDTPLDVRKVHSYPSCAKTLRGCGGDVVYMEEAAFMALDVFFEVIVPLL